MAWFYSWRIRDRRTGNWRTLRWKMREETARDWARLEGLEIERVENSGEDRGEPEPLRPSGGVQRTPDKG